MSIQKKLGQNFLNSKSIAKFIVDSATISKNNTVYEIGIGKGILTPYLCEQSKNVISAPYELLGIDKLSLSRSQSIFTSSF